LYGSPLRSEDRAWVPRDKVLEMANFGGGGEVCPYMATL